MIKRILETVNKKAPQETARSRRGDGYSKTGKRRKLAVGGAEISPLNSLISIQ
jgi:hypothetical protein